MKFELAWEHDIYIIEAERSASEDEVKVFNLKRKRKIVDFVDIAGETEIEIIFKHEKDEQIFFYRKTGVIPIILGETILCEVCNRTYPRRNKKNICQVCKD